MVNCYWKYISKTNHDNDMYNGKLEEGEKDSVTSGALSPLCCRLGSLSHTPCVKAPATLFLSPRGRDAIHQPCSTSARGQFLTCTPCQRQAGLPWLLTHQLQKAERPPSHNMGSPCCLPASGPGEGLDSLQPHSFHLLFASLELLSHLQA